jgi:hypothetical protein
MGIPEGSVREAARVSYVEEHGQGGGSPRE